jgi:hypothetical protein
VEGAEGAQVVVRVLPAMEALAVMEALEVMAVWDITAALSPSAPIRIPA